MSDATEPDRVGDAGAARGRQLSDKTAIVTGAGQGVGAGIALALASEGANVVCAGRTLSKVEATVAEIGSRAGAGAGKGLALECNVARPDEVDACVARTVEQFGTVDILVNNAVVSPLGPLLEVTDKLFELGFRVGPLATLRFMRACHPYLKGSGVVVNLTSGSALRTDPSGLGGYAALKESISSLTRTAAVEWGPDGIRVVSLMPLAMSPGFEFWQEYDRPAYEALLKEVPLGRIGDCEADIGRAAVFLCGPDARYITGTTLVVDGGQSYLR